MIRIGMNPLGEERMLGNFNAKNTKERASAPKKKVCLSVLLGFAAAAAAAATPLLFLFRNPLSRW